jgi:hypothetical protein
MDTEQVGGVRREPQFDGSHCSVQFQMENSDKDPDKDPAWSSVEKSSIPQSHACSNHSINPQLSD